MSVRCRFAPAPSGSLHVGNVRTGLFSWAFARHHGGVFVLRIEDTDASRVTEEAFHGVMDSLRWLGIDWDEGPDVGGPHEPYEQSSRTARYEAARERLRAAGRLYPCFCSRADIAAAASAPQESGDELRYPETCRRLDAEQARRRIEAGERHSWRFAMDGEDQDGFEDLVRGGWRSASPPGDFVVGRSDGATAYQLAVVVDDAEMGITEVVRGDDLLASTLRQLSLYRVLGWPAPRFGHVPLLVDAAGVRLSKRQQGITLRELRDGGMMPETLIGRLASLLRLRPRPEPLAARELLDGFDLRRLPREPDGLVVDVAAWQVAGGGA